jgi:hypothetical protein
MRQVPLIAILVLGLAACGGSGASKSALKITIGRSGGTLMPFSLTVASDGSVTSTGTVRGSLSPLTSAEHAKLSGLVRTGLPSLESAQCSGTFPDESAYFITALGKTITVRGTCKPDFTELWSTLAEALNPS